MEPSINRIQLAEKIAEAWNSAGINYAVVHGIESYPHSIGRDLDVLIESKDIERALRIVLQICEKYKWTCVKPPDIWGKRLVCFGSDLWQDALEIHTLTALSLKGIVFVNKPLPTVQKGPCLIDPWAHFVKHLLGPVLSNQLERIKETHLIEEYTNIVKQGIYAIMGERLGELVLQKLHTLDIQALRGLLPYIKLRIVYRVLFKSPHLFVVGFLKSIWRKLIQIFYPCGPIIEIIGEMSSAKPAIAGIKESGTSIFTDIVIREQHNSFMSMLLASFRSRIDSARQRVVIYIGKAAFIKPDLTIIFEPSPKQESILESKTEEMVYLKVPSSKEVIDCLHKLIIQAFIKKNEKYHS